MKLSIFGANLRDQSKGTFEVHRHDCSHCARLRRIGEHESVEEHDSMEAVAAAIYSDQIAEGSCTVSDALGEIWFAPCVVLHLPDKSEP